MEIRSEEVPALWVVLFRRIQESRLGEEGDKMGISAGCSKPSVSHSKVILVFLCVP